MSQIIDEREVGFPFEPKYIHALRPSIESIDDRAIAGKVGWELFGGLYRSFSMLQTKQSFRTLGWSSDFAVDLLRRAHEVAGRPKIASRPGENQPRYGDWFMQLHFPLVDRLEDRRVSVAMVSALDVAFLDGYELMSGDSSAQAFLSVSQLKNGLQNTLQAVSLQLDTSK